MTIIDSKIDTNNPTVDYNTLKKNLKQKQQTLQTHGDISTKVVIGIVLYAFYTLI